MNATRLTSLFVLIAASAGLAMLVINDDWLVVLAGAVLVVTSALVLSRHFWRAGGMRWKRESAELMRSIAVELATLRTQVQETGAVHRRVLDELAMRTDAFSRGLLEYQAQIELDIENQRLDIENQREVFEDELRSLRADLREAVLDQNRRFELADERATKRNVALVGELSGVLAVYEVLKPMQPYPPFGGWAIAGDCARRLVDSIMTESPRWIVEAGSGLSTVLVARTLQLIGGEGQLISLEHDEAWREKTQMLVDEHGVSQHCRIVYAPLVELDVGEERYMWYDLSEVDLPEAIDLLFIDGPPKAVGDLARFPAIPLLYDRLSQGAVILMDDADRPDERKAVSRWQSDYPNLDPTWHRDTKGTVQLTKGPK